MKSLATARIIGYYSLPSPFLAEHNPDAYNGALRDAPPGAGTCSQCGMALVHHAIIEQDGAVRVVGLDCALKVGADPQSIRLRETSEQRDAREARNAAWDAKRRQAEQERNERRAERTERHGAILALLRATGSDFHASLADQLAERPLSDRQALFVAKATSATGRRNKGNAAAWDAIIEQVTAA